MKILPDALEFETIEDLCIFLRYDAKNAKSIPPGYVTAEDMLNNKGGVLYAKDTELDASRLGRLIRIIENNPEVKPKFAVKLNDVVIKIEQAKILAAIKQLIESKASRKVYARFIGMTMKIIETRFQDIFTSTEIILIYKQIKIS